MNHPLPACLGLAAVLGMVFLLGAVCYEPRCRADWWWEMRRTANRG